METEDQICRRYEGELAAIAALDRRYYLKLAPTTADRRDYAERQLCLQEIRSRFYADLTACRLDHFLRVRRFRRCRSLVRKPRFSTVRSS